MMFRFSIGDVLTRGFSILGKNFLAFVLITALVQAPALAVGLYVATRQLASVQDLQQTRMLLVAQFLAALLLTPLSSATVTYGVLQQLRGKHASLGDCFRMGLSRALPVLGVALVAGLLFLLGWAACVIPGLILMTGYFVATPAAVVERLGVLGSLSRSWQLTSGYRWSVLGVIVIVKLLAKAIDLAVDLPTHGLEGDAGIAAAGVKLSLGVVTAAFDAVIGAVAYHDLRVEKEGVNSQDLARVFD